jgi:transcriptional regulator with XRE-family HTH domain
VATTKVPAPAELLVCFAARLMAARESRGLSRRDLGQRTGITQMSLIYYERGQQLPNGQYIVRLCRELGVSADHLLGLDGGPGAEARAVCDRNYLRAARVCRTVRVSYSVEE